MSLFWGLLHSGIENEICPDLRCFFENRVIPLNPEPGF